MGIELKQFLPAEKVHRRCAVANTGTSRGKDSLEAVE